MMAYSSRRFVSVFYDLAHEYPQVYADDAALATWLRLLMIADAIWPAPAQLPRSVKDRTLKPLVETGLVIVVGDTFQIKGLDKQRTQQREQAREAALAMHKKRATALAGADATAERAQSNVRMPSTAQHSTADRSLSLVGNSSVEESDDNGDSGVEREDLQRDGLPSLTPEALAALEERTKRPFSQVPFRTQGEFDRIVGDYGLPKVLAAIDRVRKGQTMTANQIVWPAARLLEPFASLPDQKAAEVEERAQERASAAENRALTTIRLNHFQHLTPHPRCPECPDVTPAIDPKAISH